MTLLQVHDTDSVAVCPRDTQAGERLSFAGGVIQVCSDTPRGHKIALTAHQLRSLVSIDERHINLPPGDRISFTGQLR